MAGKSKQKTPTEHGTPQNPFPVVGIGASAGGLEALISFLSSMPPHTGIAYIIVTHQSPDYPNLLPDLLQRHTAMKVLEAYDNVHIRTDHIYLSSPAFNLCMLDGALKLTERKVSRAMSAPIDYFLRTLAEVQDSKAIGIILSGTGTDGAVGLKELKARGGMIMVQAPESARFSGMPSNAIATGIVDFILTPEQMPLQLLDYAEGLKRETAVLPERHLLPSEGLKKILSLLHQTTGNDFAHYKMNTIGRRIERRMNLYHLKKWEEYLRYLQENPPEIQSLFKELLIGVSSFFRDSEAFEHLSKSILPTLLDSKQENDSVRIWVPGCSTGEEVYSLAILIREYMDLTGKYMHVQIYGTDLDENAINMARNGLYCDGIALDIDPKRLERHFLREGEHYRIRKTIREMAIFAVQNLVQDPPFTRLDMVSCRNLLIYLDRPLQERILPMFHYALKSAGVLFLGSSESTGNFASLFNPLNARWKIYQRIDTNAVTSRMRDFQITARNTRPAEDLISIASKRFKEASLEELTEKLLLRRFVPASALVNKDGEVIYIHGRTSTYLEATSGRVPTSHNIVDMAREGLRLPLAAIIRKAAEQDEPIRQKNLTFHGEDHTLTVDIIAQRLREPEAVQGLVLLSFEIPSDNKTPIMLHENKNDDLERELLFIKEHLRRTIEELETTNEELKSTNEELQSANEELQSANEELETSREEMQSLNEEMHAVNAELETKNKDLAYSYDDMKNLLNSTGVATIFVDDQLLVKRFTMQAKKVIHLIQSDIGRSIRDIATELEYKDLIEDAEKVLHTLVYKEVEVKTRDWCWYLMRIMPYRTANNVIDGLVITFVEISKLKKAEIMLGAHNAALEALAKSRPLPEILDALLHAIERHSHGLCCSVHVIDGERLIEASTGCLPRGLARVMTEFAISQDAAEPFVQAIYKKEAMNQIGLESLKETHEFARVALSHGFRSCWALPVFTNDGRLVGVFTIFHAEARNPTALETELMKDAATLTGLAIQRKHAEDRYAH